MSPPRRAAPEAGLCAACRHARPLESARGSRFWRCGRAAEDRRYPRYPPLPVRACAGFQPAPASIPGRRSDGGGTGA